MTGGTDAAIRHNRGKHEVHLVGAAARGQEVKVALPDLGWDVDADGNITLPVADVTRIVGKGMRRFGVCTSHKGNDTPKRADVSNCCGPSLLTSWQTRNLLVVEV